ncbi:MAG TPA: hypothetical protein VG013_12385 [Gemmataceae bacterium]|nr:hypothetical protein [Gemmataceae bacterium]
MTQKVCSAAQELGNPIKRTKKSGSYNRMVYESPLLQYELERHVQVRTGRRVRDLAIELSPERVVVRGRADTYYVKQLAQHGIRDVLPQVSLENAIVVAGVN